MLVLHKLNNDGKQRASQLTKTLSKTTGGLTGLTDKLVDGEYIRRERAKDDWRVVYLSITRTGEEAIQSMYDTGEVLIEQLFQSISTLELKEFKATAYKLLNNFEGIEIKID